MKRFSIAVLGGAVLSAVTAVTLIGPRAAAAQAGTPQATIPPYVAPCDTADILALIGDKGAMQRAPRHAAALILGRIIACRQLIDSYEQSVSPPPPPVVSATFPRPVPTLQPRFAPPPPECDPKTIVTTSGDPIKLYGILGVCVAYVKAIPAPSATSTPGPIRFQVASDSGGSSAETRLIFALALANDAPTSAQLSLRLARELAPKLSVDGTAIDPYTGKNIAYKVVSQPTWTLTQYQQQCLNDPSTRGAVVLMPPGTQSAVANALLFSWSWTNLDLQAMALDCEPGNVAYTNNVAYVTWVSDVASAPGRRYGVPLASLLGVISGITSLRPIHNTGTVNSFAIAPPSPAPSPGAIVKSGYTQSDSTQTNPNGNAYIVASSALAPLSSATVGQVGSIDSQLAVAAKRAIPALLSQLSNACPDRVLGSNDVGKYATQCFWLRYPRKI